MFIKKDKKIRHCTLIHSGSKNIRGAKVHQISSFSENFRVNFLSTNTFVLFKIHAIIPSH